ncbi:hypothetical protein V1525DRAFT_397544 [Lipomyces kononenkoae]|uniref:Uncharacterized protein n=1 Tax=Lipomyces kononenkoae TaxID=34357 RepID=A0ACC3T809_LIPKO
MDTTKLLSSPLSSASSSPLTSPRLPDYFFRRDGAMPQSGRSSPLWDVLTSSKSRRYFKRAVRVLLVATVLLAFVLSLPHIYRHGFFENGDEKQNSTVAANYRDSNNRNETERAKFMQHLNMTRQLAAHPSPLTLLQYCANDRRLSQSSANFLVSALTDERTLARMDFQTRGKDAPRYNPNLLPFPKNYKHPYIGFARQSPKGVLYHHEIVWCEMDWRETPGIGRKILVCVTQPQILQLAEWGTKEGLCTSIPYMALQLGHSDPRILFSPRGEPLMVVGNNGISNCMGQFVIDLRVVVPGLNWKMNLQGVQIRYKELTELPRPKYNEIEKNWFLMWDEQNVGYVQHDIEQRSVSLLHGQRSKQVNIAAPAPDCVSSLKKKLSGTHQGNDIHQATNSLRVTLCDFPCIPTIHNTVIVELMHVKYMNHFEIFYRRYAIIMNATAPFNIIGRTGNLMYAGTDERTMLYTVSITWDHEHHRDHEDWNESLHGGHWFLDQINNETVADGPANDHSAMLHKRAARAGRADQSSGSVAVAAPSAASSSSSSSIQPPTATATATAKQDEKEIPQNPLVNKYYHGWLDDMIMINIGIDDKDSGVLHVRARDLLECMHVCQ